ncbi:MAG: tetratricopeptide repeat protein [Planctomycetota bacterium]
MKALIQKLKSVVFLSLLIVMAHLPAQETAPEWLKPYELDYEAMTESQLDDYGRLWEAWNTVGDPQATGAATRAEIIKAFKVSESQITRAFVPLLEGLEFKVKGALDKAETKMMECLQKNPNELQANLELGNIYLRRRENGKAHAHLNRFVGGVKPDKVDKTVARDLVMAYIDLARMAVSSGNEARLEELLGLAEKVDVKEAKEIVSQFRVYDSARKTGPSGWVFDGETPNAWKIETEHYTVMTNVDKKFCEKLANDAEVLRRMFERDLAYLGKSPSEKRPIIVFKSEREYQIFNVSLGGEAMENIVGYFHKLSKFLVLWNDQKTSYSTSNTGEDFPEVLKTMYHEMFHQYLDFFHGLAPVWLNEGVASMYENTKVKGPNGTMLKACDFHVEIIRDLAQGTDFYNAGAFKPVQDVLALEGSSSLHYGYFCTLQYFCKNKRKKALEMIFADMKKGIYDTERLSVHVIGKSLDTTEKEWLAYCKAMHR